MVFAGIAKTVGSHHIHRQLLVSGCTSTLGCICKRMFGTPAENMCHWAVATFAQLSLQLTPHTSSADSELTPHTSSADSEFVEHAHRA